MIRGGRERERGALRLGPFGLVAVAALVVAAIALVIILRSGDNGKPSLDKGDTKVSIERSYGKLPLAFEPNAGRYPAGLRYRARSESGSVLLSRSGAELIAASQKPNRFALEFTGGSPTSVVGDDKLDGVVNDLRGDDPAAADKDCAMFADSFLDEPLILCRLSQCGTPPPSAARVFRTAGDRRLPNDCPRSRLSGLLRGPGSHIRRPCRAIPRSPHRRPFRLRRAV